MKYDLEKNEKKLKAMAPSLIDLVVLLIGFFGGALALDLNLTYFGSACSYAILYEVITCSVWIIHSFIHAIIKKKRGVNK